MSAGGAIARRYARALFSLGEESGDPAQLLAEVEALAATAAEYPPLGRVLFTPIHPRAERRGVLDALVRKLGLSKELRAFAMILVDENRMPLLPEIRDVLEGLVARAAGRVTARVTTARPLTRTEQRKLQKALARRVNAEVTIEAEVDETLIGGVLARVGDLLLDGSLRTQLDSLRGSLRKGSA